MKAKVSIEFYFTPSDWPSAEGVVGEYTPSLRHGTHLTVDGVEQTDSGDGTLESALPAPGNTLRLVIPSGIFDGVVDSTFSFREDESEWVVTATGQWDGQWAGLVGGLSCYGRFVPCVLSDVESSWGTYTVGQYRAMRDVRDHFPSAEAAREALGRIKEWQTEMSCY